MCREHPLRILKYSTKTLWLLVFPLLRGALNVKKFLDFEEIRNFPEMFLNWLHGVWFDLFILVVIIGYGWFVWFFRKFTVTENQIYIQDGFFITRKRILPLKHLSSLTIERPFWLKPCKASYLYADTASGRLELIDITLLIRWQDEAMFCSALPGIHDSKRHHYQQKAKIWQILLFSVIFSSSFSGALYFAMFCFQGGRIANDLIQTFQLTQRLEIVSEEVAAHLAGIQPAAVTVGILILSSWLYSLIYNLFRYGGFYMESDKQRLFVRSGILTHRQFYLQNHKINFLDMRQNVITKIFHVFSLQVNCPGYATQKNSQPICLPLLTQRQLMQTLPLLFPGRSTLKNQLCPPKSSLFGYLSIWLTLLLSILPLTRLLKHLLPTVQELLYMLHMFDLINTILPAGEVAEQLLPTLEEIVSSLQFMIALPIFWKCIVQVSALCTNGIAISDQRVCMRYCKGFSFHTIVAYTDCIVKIRIRRYFWHRLSGKCHVTVYFRSEKPRSCTLYGMDYQQTRQELSEFLIPDVRSGRRDILVRPDKA